MAAKKAKEIGRRAIAQSVQGPIAVLPPGYAELLEDLKNRIRRAQVRAAVAASRELIRLYWDIGREIVQRQDREGWGAKVIDRLAADLQKALPGHFRFFASQCASHAGVLSRLHERTYNCLAACTTIDVCSRRATCATIAEVIQQVVGETALREVSE